MENKKCKECNTIKNKTEFYLTQSLCKKCICIKNKIECSICWKKVTNLNNHILTINEKENEFSIVKHVKKNLKIKI